MKLNDVRYYFYDGRIMTATQLKNKYIEFLQGYVNDSDFFNEINFNYWIDNNTEVDIFPLVKFEDSIYVDKNNVELVKEIRNLLHTSEGLNELMKELDTYGTYIDNDDIEHYVYELVNDDYVIV